MALPIFCPRGWVAIKASFCAYLICITPEWNCRNKQGNINTGEEDIDTYVDMTGWVLPPKKCGGRSTKKLRPDPTQG